MHAFEFLVIGVGLAVGGLAGWLWYVVSARLGDDQFWQRLNKVLQMLLSAEGEERFFQEYVRLLPLLFKFVAKKLLTLVLAFAPVVIALAVLMPFAERVWDSRVTHIEISPPQAATIEVAGQTYRATDTENKLPGSVELHDAARISAAAGDFRVDSLMRKQAHSRGWLQHFTLWTLGWESLEPESPPADTPPADSSLSADGPQPTAVAPPSLLLRPSSGDDNVLWPYLNDWEFDFLIAVSLASLAGMLAAKVRKR